MESDTTVDTIGTLLCVQNVERFLVVDVAMHSRAVKHYKVQNCYLVHSGKKSKAEANTMLIIAIAMSSC